MVSVEKEFFLWKTNAIEHRVRFKFSKIAQLSSHFSKHGLLVLIEERHPAEENRLST
jgi:uncharacterized NAD(P)/FAD-binding protein YdhS